MWVNSIPQGRGWTFLWSGKVLCNCGGIRLVERPCPACDAPPYDCSPQRIKLPDGTEMEIPTAFMGAEGRYEDYLYLHMMEREWVRSAVPSPQMLNGVSEKASVVLLFWTYFETRIERLLRVGLKGVPTTLAEDTLDRNSSIAARLERLYKVLFGTTYEKDLKESGYTDLYLHIKEVQRRRNEFMHGNPQAIDDAFVFKVVEKLQEEHEAWIHLFNKRVRAMRT
ncbi:MAG: hypothetical protein JWQ01_2785 [Massilia sp.]|nr:hypothetical protein [Massilia sp.]